MKQSCWRLTREGTSLQSGLHSHGLMGSMCDVSKSVQHSGVLSACNLGPNTLESTPSCACEASSLP